MTEDEANALSEKEIACEACGGDGCFDEVYIRPDHSEGNRHTDCTLCDGTGKRVVECEPVTLTDLEAVPPTMLWPMPERTRLTETVRDDEIREIFARHLDGIKFDSVPNGPLREFADLVREGNPTLLCQRALEAMREIANLRMVTSHTHPDDCICAECD